MKSMVFFVLAATLAAFCVAGCQSDAPNTPPGPVGGGRVSGTPQQRIESIQNNPTMSDAEKQRRIAAIKQNNHLQ